MGDQRDWSIVGDWEGLPGGVLRRWKDHLVIKGDNCWACLDCGRMTSVIGGSRARTLRVWGGEPCNGIRKLPVAVRSRFAAGLFDADLRRCLNVVESGAKDALSSRHFSALARVPRRLDDENIIRHG